MTEPQTITVDHVRSLLEAERGDTALALIAGRVEVVGPDQLAGTLEVISRDELVERVGPAPTDDALAEQAAALTTAVQTLGG